MKKCRLSTTGMLVMMTVLLSLADGFAVAAGNAPMTPELATKREMVRKQQEQRITNDKRKTAAAALKVERVKIYNARHEAQKLTPATTGLK